jgi:hypothetical protein
MNCFNIRELQGILKRRFFTDLVNSNDHRDLLNDSMIGLRFKLNNSQSIEPDIFSFYNIGTTNTLKSKNINLTSVYEAPNFGPANFNIGDILPTLTLPVVNQGVLVNSATYTPNMDLNVLTFFYNGVTAFQSIHYSSIASPFNFIEQLKQLFSLNFNFTLDLNPATKVLSTGVAQTGNLTYSSTNLQTAATAGITSMSENTNYGRFNRFSNLMVNYDFKCGHYLGI